MTEFTE